MAGCSPAIRSPAAGWMPRSKRPFSGCAAPWALKIACVSGVAERAGRRRHDERPHALGWRSA